MNSQLETQTNNSNHQIAVLRDSNRKPSVIVVNAENKVKDSLFIKRLSEQFGNSVSIVFKDDLNLVDYDSRDVANTLVHLLPYNQSISIRDSFASGKEKRRLRRQQMR